MITCSKCLMNDFNDSEIVFDVSFSKQKKKCEREQTAHARHSLSVQGSIMDVGSITVQASRDSLNDLYPYYILLLLYITNNNKPANEPYL